MNHVTALESMAAQLNDLGVGITEHDIMTKIVCSLPSRFDNLVSSWDGMPENDKTLSTLRARLVAEERKITLRLAQAQTNGKTDDGGTPQQNNAFVGNGGQDHARKQGQYYRGRGGRSYRGNQYKSNVRLRL